MEFSVFFSDNEGVFQWLPAITVYSVNQEPYDYVLSAHWLYWSLDIGVEL